MLCHIYCGHMYLKINNTVVIMIAPWSIEKSSSLNKLENREAERLRLFPLPPPGGLLLKIKKI